MWQSPTDIHSRRGEDQNQQSVYTTFFMVGKKIDDSAAAVEEMRESLAGTGLFVPGGGEIEYSLWKSHRKSKHALCRRSLPHLRTEDESHRTSSR